MTKKRSIIDEPEFQRTVSNITNPEKAKYVPNLDYKPEERKDEA